MTLHSTLAMAFASAVLASSDAPTPDARAPSASPATEEPDAPPESAPQSPPGDVRSYDAAIRASSRAAETLQGPLQGSWVLAGKSGRRLYRIELADHGLGPGTIEGAWRDLRFARPGVHSGLLSSVARHGDRLLLSFDEAGASDPVTVAVSLSGAIWTGRMRRGGRMTQVILKRG